MEDKSKTAENEQMNSDLLNKALDRLRSDAVYGINSGDHEIMNPDNYQKEMQQHFDDVQLIQQALH